MLLSIIIPVFNKEKYIQDCLDSIFMQSFEVGNDIEIICVDDGSTDKSLDILEQYAVRHTQIKLIAKKNGGVSSARNAGLNIANGKYVTFIDPDDIVTFDYVKTVLSAIEGDVDRLHFRYYTVVDNKKTYQELRENLTVFPSYFSNSNIWSSVFKLDIIKKNGICFDEAISNGEDCLFQFLYRLYAKPCKRIESVLYCYRTNSDSVTNTRTRNARLKEVKDYIKICTIMKRTYDLYDSAWLCDKADVCESLVAMLRILLERIAYLPLKDRNSMMKELGLCELFPFPIPFDYPITKEMDIRWAPGQTLLQKRVYCKISSFWGFKKYRLVYALNIIKTRIQISKNKN